MLFLSTVLVERWFPEVMGTAWWNPVPFEAWLAWRIYAAPSLPSMLAFALLFLTAFWSKD